MLSEKHKAHLQKLLDGPALIPAIVSGHLVSLGYAAKTGEPGARGYSHVAITDAGRAALA